MRCLRSVAVAAAGFALIGGCTPMQQAAIDATLRQGEAGIKAAHDREALALKQAPCAMSVGGYVRALTPAERDAILTLCGGEEGITLGDLGRFSRALEFLERMPRGDETANVGR